MQDGTSTPIQPKTTSTEDKKEEKKKKSCVVKFRPCKDWRGEYGFDWVREKSEMFEEACVPDENGYYTDLELERKEEIDRLRDAKARLENGEDIEVEFESPYDQSFYTHLNPATPWMSQLIKQHEEFKKNRSKEQIIEELRHAIATLDTNVVINKSLPDEESIGEYAYSPVSRDQKKYLINRVKYKLFKETYKIWEILEFDYFDNWNGDVIASDTEKCLKDNIECLLNSFLCIPGTKTQRVSCFADLNGEKTVKLPYYYDENGKFFMDGKWRSVNLNTKVYVQTGKTSAKPTSQSLLGFMREFALEIPESDSYKNYLQSIPKKCIILNNNMHFLSVLLLDWSYKKITFDIGACNYLFVYRTLEDGAGEQKKLVHAMVNDKTNSITYELLFEDGNPLKVFKAGKWVEFSSLDNTEKNRYNGFVKDNDEEGYINSLMLKTDEMVLSKIKSEYENVIVESYRPISFKMNELGNFEDEPSSDSSLVKHYITIDNKKIQLKTWYEAYLETFRPLVTKNAEILKDISIVTYPVPTLSTALSSTKERYKFFYKGNKELPTMKKMEHPDEFEIQFFIDKLNENCEIPDKLRLQSECPMLSFKKKYGGAGFENPLEITKPNKDDSVIVKIKECVQTCDFCVKNNSSWRGKKYYEEQKFHFRDDFWTLYKPVILARGEFEGNKYLASSIRPFDICGQLNVQIADGLKMPVLFVDVKVDGAAHPNSLNDAIKIQKEFMKNIASQAGISIEIHDSFDVSLEKKFVKKYQTSSGLINLEMKDQGIMAFFKEIIKNFLNKYTNETENNIVKTYAENIPILFVFNKPFSSLNAFQTNIKIGAKSYNFIAISNKIAKSGLSQVCAHELIHALKNPHSFQLYANEAYGNNDFCFRYLKTSNIMDYVLMAYSTHRFQWNRMITEFERIYCKIKKSDSLN